MGTIITGIVAVLGAVTWLVLLVVTGFSAVILSLGLLTALCLLGSPARSNH